MRRISKNLIALAPVVLAVGFMVGCSSDPTDDTDGGTDELCALGEADCCVRASQCQHLSDGQFTATCDEGACVLQCNVSADCTQLAPERCSGGDCVCDEGSCLVPACSADVDCGGAGKCVGGSCQAGTRADACVIAPDPVYLHEGATVNLRAFALAGGEYVVPDGDFSWSSANDAVASVDASGAVTGGATEDGTTITATVDDATCTVDVVNYAAVAAATDVRVVVFDEVARTPVSGATVVVEVPGGEPVTGTTEADGSVTLAGIAAASVSVHVFTATDANTADAPNGYAYISVVDTAAKDMVVYLPRNAAPSTAGGFKGELTPEDFEALGSEQVHLAIAGASIPGNFVDLDLDLLVGELVPTHIELGSIAEDVSLPSGVVAGLSKTMFKSDYKPLSLPGTRTGWMLAGNVPLEDVMPLAQAAQSGDVNIGEAMTTLLPLIGGFHHGVRPGIEIGETARLTDGTPDYDDNAAFPNVDFDLDTQLALRGLVEVPTLPQLAGSYLDGVVVLGGANVRGQGLVPLGITAGLDILDDTLQTKNGVVNDEGEDPMAGLVPLRLAPQHGGIEGGGYVVLGLAIGFDAMGMEGQPQAISGFATEVPSIGFDQQIDLGPDSFLGFPEGAQYTVGTRAYTPAAVAGADLYRLAIDDANDRTWVVYHGGTGAISLVDPAEFGHEDRATGAELNVDAQALATRGALGIDGLFAFDGDDLDDMVRVVSGFSTIDADVVQ